MRHRLVISDVRKAMKEAEEDVAQIVTVSMAEATELLKADLRDDVEEAGLGVRLGRTWRSRLYPQGDVSLDAAGYVWTKAPNIILAYDEGVTIRARNGARMLAFPTQAGKRLVPDADGKLRKVTPKSFEASTGLTLRYVPRNGRRPALYVVDGARLNSRGRAVSSVRKSRSGGKFTPIANRMTIAVFVLVPNVKVQKRLHIDAVANRAAGRVDGILSKNWK